MAYIRLKEHRTRGDIVIQGVGETVYSINEKPVEIPARIAALYLGDEQMIVEFIDSDKKDIKGMPENRLVSIREHLGLDEGADVLNVLYPKKAKATVKKKVEEVVETVTETVVETVTPEKKTPAPKKTTTTKKEPAKKTTTKKEVE